METYSELKLWQMAKNIEKTVEQNEIIIDLLTKLLENEVKKNEK